MLRDLLSGNISNDDDLLMNTRGTTITATNHDETTYEDPLDDVFGSAPSSPNLPTTTTPANAEHSDVPRLRSIHVTSGYREGIAASKEQHIQAGFDEGYSLGGEIGMKAGYCLGVLEGTCAAKKIEGRGKEMFARAQEELDMEKLLSPEWFGEDGIWLFEVVGEGEEGEVTFRDVALAHPVVKKWLGRVDELARSCDLSLA